MAEQQLSSRDALDGASFNVYAQEMDQFCCTNEQLSRNELALRDRCNVDGDGVICSKQSKTITKTKMRSSEKIDDKANTNEVTPCMADGGYNPSHTHRSGNRNCDNSSEHETNTHEYSRTSAVTAANGGGSDSGVGFDLGIGDDDIDDDPYAELEFYLEKVKVSIMLVYYLLFSSSGLPRSN